VDRQQPIVSLKWGSDNGVRIITVYDIPTKTFERRLVITIIAFDAKANGINDNVAGKACFSSFVLAPRTPQQNTTPVIQLNFIESNPHQTQSLVSDVVAILQNYTILY